jgi:hypothetical protein
MSTMFDRDRSMADLAAGLVSRGNGRWILSLYTVVVGLGAPPQQHAGGGVFEGAAEGLMP